jgi:hypothetical protein
MEAVRTHDAAAWWKAFLANLERVRSADDPAGWRSPEPIREALKKLQATAPPEVPEVLGRPAA